MNRLTSKVIAIVVLWIFPLLCTLLPLKVYDYFIRKGKYGKEVMGWLMCFGGGVFFATYILHMVPEVQAILGPALIEKYKITYPVTELIMAAGFFLVLTIEILAMDQHKRSVKKNCSSSSLDQASHGSEHVSMKCTGTELDVEETHCLANGDTPHLNGHVKVELNGTGGVHDADDTAVIGSGDVHGVTYEHTGHDHHAARSLILIIALSLHRIFEGMSVGLKYTEHAVWSLTLAVVCHETVISFSLGLQFVKNQFSCCRTFLYALVCSLILPIGMTIGTVLVEAGNQSETLNLINGILQGLSTGTFIYVTFFEILADEINHMSATKIRLLFLLLGFGSMALLNMIPEDDEVLLEQDSSENVTSMLIHDALANNSTVVL